jgi:hypothetical protein
LGSKDCWNFSGLHSGSEKLIQRKVQERKVNDVRRRSSSPPSLSNTELAPLWSRLPPDNRERLLWLMSHLLELQLTQTTTATKGRSHESE